MKTAALLAGVAITGSLLAVSPAQAQFTASGITQTISTANTVNQSQTPPPPVRDAKFEAIYGRQPAASQRTPAPAAIAPATPVAQPAVTAPAQPVRDAKFESIYGRQPASSQRAATAPTPAAGNPYGAQPQAGAAPVVIQQRPARAPDPEREQRIIDFQTQSAMSGNPTSQYDLGMRYLDGDGVDEDRDQALSWLTLAAKGGNTKAKKQLQLLNKEAKTAKAKPEKSDANDK